MKVRIETNRDGSILSLRRVGELMRYREIQRLIEAVTPLLADSSVTEIRVDLTAVNETGPLAGGALAALEMSARSEVKALVVDGVWGLTRELLRGEGVSV